LTKPGEIVLGYPDHYGYVDYNPLVPGESDTGSFLRPPSKEDQKRGAAPESRMFGRNGSYLVIRQLEQDVAHFWRFARRAAITNGESTERFAAKLIGRWPDGAPLVTSPDSHDRDQAEKNDFSYADDPNGMKCPFGAHIRRGNPRDMLAPLKTDQHRILRRGRSYGPEIPDKFEDDGRRRGLFFICLNSDLERQFELIQQSWVNNRFFNGLSSEVDPITHIHDNKMLTLPTDPLRRQVVRLNDEEPFVTVKGGAYFFMPGISALRYLAALR
jgi:Dyp-type peroxidase family